MREEIYTFKIIGADRLPMRDETIQENEQEVSQRAKQITIYSNVHQDKDWRRILQNITDNFLDNGICPSYLPQGDRAFSGSRFPGDTSPYFSYSYRTKQGNRAEFRASSQINILLLRSKPKSSTSIIRMTFTLSIPLFSFSTYCAICSMRVFHALNARTKVKSIFGQKKKPMKWFFILRIRRGYPRQKIFLRFLNISSLNTMAIPYPA